MHLTDELIEINGNTDTFFDCCKRLLECSEMLMLLQTPAHRIAVWGRDLQASDYSVHGLHIQGSISVIEFDGGLS